MASTTLVAMRLVVMLAALQDCTMGEENVHFRIVVPEFINTMTHTKTVYVMPKKGKSLEDPGLASALGAAGGGTALGGTYGGAMGTGYGPAAGFAGPAPTAAGYGVTSSDGSGYTFVNGGARPSVTNLGVSGHVLTSFGHNAQHVRSGPSPTPPSLPVLIPLRAPPLPPPPPPGTIIVAAGHDASLAELLSHSNRVRSTLRAQRFLRFNTVQPTGGVTATPLAQVTNAVHTPRLQSQQHGVPSIPPELQPVYGYYGLNAGHRYQPITVYQTSSANQAAKSSKCHGGNLVGVSGSIVVQDGQNVKNGHFYTSPQTHGNTAVIHPNGHGYFSSGGSFFTGFTTPQTVSVNPGQSLYNAYNALPMPPAYSALQVNQNGGLNVRPTMTPVVTTSGHLSNTGYSTTQVYPTGQYHSNVYQGNQFRQPSFNSYGNRLPNPYGAQPFSVKDGRHTFSGSPQHYHGFSTPLGSTVSINPQDYRGSRNNKHKNDSKSPIVKCTKDDKNGLVCVASANVQKNTENATKVYVGDAWSKTKQLKSKDKGIRKVNAKIKGKLTPLKKHKKKKGDDDTSQMSVSGESMSASGEDQNVGDIPPASEENSTPQNDHANLEGGDFSASITTSAYGAAAGSDETPEAQQASQEQAGGDYSGDQDSRQAGRAVPTDMDVEGDGDSMKKGFRLQTDQWIPINPARLEQDDSTQDQAGEKRDTSSVKDYSTGEQSPTPAPLKSTTVVLGVTRDYKPLQAFFGRQVPDTTPTPTKIANLQNGDMYWSMVRGNVERDDEATEHVNDEPSATEATVKLSNGLGIDDHLSLINGWGSHIDGTEDALSKPEAFPPESKPADISSEVHLTTAIPGAPDGIALYYQKDAEEETNTQGHDIKQDEEADDEHKGESHFSTTIPSITTSRFRGKIKYSDHLTTLIPDEDGDLQSREVSPSDGGGDKAVGELSEDPIREVAEDSTEESQEDDGEVTDKPDALADELRKDIESTKENLQSALDNRAKISGPKIISESGHILRGLAVAEQLDVQRW